MDGPQRAELIARDRAVIVAVDLQQRLAPAIDGIDAVKRHATRLLRAAAALGVPVIFTEQYPKGLGPTDPAIRETAPAGEVMEKVCFGALGEPANAARFARLRAEGRDQAVIFGTETHVCVLQTAMQLLAAGWTLFLAEDACGSRRPADRAAGIARLAQAGARRATVEMAMFELLARADSDDFRALLPLIRDDAG